MSPEFSRVFALDTLGSVPHAVHLAANDQERAALSQRFDLKALDQLEANVALVVRASGIEATGLVRASAVQRCVVTADPVASTIETPFTIRFVDPALLMMGDDELELTDGDLDVVAHDGGSLDLGEAVAQTFGLALDPFPRSADAPAGGEWRVGPDAGPFAALKGLLK